MQDKYGYDDEDLTLFCGLSPKPLQIIKHQEGPEFSAFLKPLALQVATKADFYEALSHFRSGQQCARALCYVNNLSLSHESSEEAFQPKQIPVVLPELRAQPHLSFTLTQRVAPAEIRQFLQARAIVSYTNVLAEKAGSLTKDSADGYLDGEIMCTGFALAVISDELHPYPTIFLNVVERLVRRLMV